MVLSNDPDQSQNHVNYSKVINNREEEISDILKNLDDSTLKDPDYLQPGVSIDKQKKIREQEMKKRKKEKQIKNQLKEIDEESEEEQEDDEEQEDEDDDDVVKDSIIDENDADLIYNKMCVDSEMRFYERETHFIDYDEIVISNLVNIIN
jgi:hypothetical protein